MYMCSERNSKDVENIKESLAALFQHCKKVGSRQSTGETAEPTVIPSSQEDEQRKDESELHLHFTPSQPAEIQSAGVSEIVSRLDEPSQGM